MVFPSAATMSEGHPKPIPIPAFPLKGKEKDE